jgi:hypothetical protein
LQNLTVVAGTENILQLFCPNAPMFHENNLRAAMKNRSVMAPEYHGAAMAKDFFGAIVW